MAGAASLSLASPWPAVAGADAAQVTVVSPGGVQRPLSLDALAGSEDVRDRSYLVRSPAGDETRTVTGFSLAKILEAAGADPFGFSYLEVQRPVGGSVLLSRHQALDPGAFPEGPPLVYATAGGTVFLRPAADDEDANGGDCFEAPQGVTIALRKGTPLQVRATASTVRAKPGQKVDFSAEVERAGAGEQLTYSWYFDDGESASGPTTSHSFAKRGSYDVVVGVTSPGDDAGTSAVVTVQVGAPAAGGPDRKGGGSNRAAGAPDSGAAAGPSGPGSGPAAAVGVGGPSAAGGGSRTAGAAASGVAAVDRTPAPSTPPPTPSPAPSSLRHSPTPDGTERVSGLLLSDADPTAAPATPAAKQVAARTGTPGDSDTGGFGLPTAAWGLRASAGLLGAGALLEARNLPAPRRPAQ
ncbi:MAG TPA: PKD domain-containing protein [Solirubrobacterales bacterium]|nr:PKD domain-containing protein [Solirubrobacterales bacterium]